MLSCRQLEMEQIESVYRRWMKKDFPPDELKPLRMIKKSLKNNAYLCIGLFDGETLCGYAYFVVNRAEACSYLLDYFAIESSRRGKGLGSQFLSMLKEITAEAEYFLCESENPDYSKDEKECSLMQRRINFYLRSGFTDTGVTVKLFGVEYRILEFIKTHDSSDVRKSYDSIYRSILPALMHKTYVHIK